MITERNFISECIRAFLGNCNAKKLNKLYKSTNKQKLNALISQQNLEGLFYNLYLNKVFNSMDISDEIIENWKIISGRNLIKNTLNDKETLRISSLLDTNKISYICMKGISNRLRIHNDDYINYSTDIDLFIKKTDYENVKKILLSDGYAIPIDYYTKKILIKIPFEEFEKRENEMSFIKKQNALDYIIDLQWDFISTDKTSVFHQLYDINPFYQFEDSDKIKINGNDLKIFSLEIEFIYMSFHYAFHHGFRGAKWLIDVCLFIKKYEAKINFDLIFRTANINLKKILGIVLMLAYEYNSDLSLSKVQKKLFFIDKLLPFEYKFYKSMIFKTKSIFPDGIMLILIKIILLYKANYRYLVVKDYLKFIVQNHFKK